ncbi:MAG: ATP-grasp domain-containing protein [Polyangiaceae bacterium]|jgi:hypothetical protein|nr:ATP-grasp domain-containing protein [Polyangiaceae bacterium]
MAPRDDAAHIAQLKLEALRKQDESLVARYEQIEAKLAEERDPLAQLRLLKDGLEALSFAGSPLHPDVVDLDLALQKGAHGALAAGQILSLVERFKGEIRQGKARARVAHLAGLCLSEHAGVDRRPAASEEGETSRQRAAFERSLMETWEAPAAEGDAGALRSRLLGLSRDLASWQAKARVFAERSAAGAVEVDEVKAHLAALSNSRYKHPEASARARRVARSETMVAEYAGALTILLNDIGLWGWADEGFDARAVWIHHKWRVYLDLDLLPWLAAEVIGSRWGAWLDACFRGVFTPADAAYPASYSHQAKRAEQLAQLSMPWLPSLEAFQSGPVGADEYGGDGGKDAMQKLFLLLNAELQLSRARGQEPHVLRTDIQDFFTTLPRSTVRVVLEICGVPEPWLGAWMRALNPPCRLQGKRLVPSRGIPLDLTCSRVVAELLMRALDAVVLQASGVQLLRLNDDITFVAPSREAAVAAWEAIQQFVAECGLSLSAPKSGAVAVGAPPDDRLPAALPRFGALALGADGCWVASEEAVESLRGNLASRVEDAASVLEMVASYNAHVRHLLSSHNLFAPLGLQAAAVRHAARLQNDLFEPGRGILQALRARLRERFPAMTAVVDEAPDAWFFWPVGLGGLGLKDPFLEIHAFARSMEAWHLPVPPQAGLSHDEAELRWGLYFGQWLAPLTPASPQLTMRLSRLQADLRMFCGEVGGALPEPYGSWLACHHGPVIEDHFRGLRLMSVKLMALHAAQEAGLPARQEQPASADDDIPFLARARARHVRPSTGAAPATRRPDLACQALLHSPRSVRNSPTSQDAEMTTLPTLLFCADPLAPRRVDSTYLAEAREAQARGFPALRMSFESLVRGDTAQALASIPRASRLEEPLLYRGWMLRDHHQAELFRGLVALGYRPLVTPEAYGQAHYLPRAYPLLREWTAESVWTDSADLDEAVATAARLGPGPAIVKDHVKSAKHRWQEACYIPDATDAEAVARVTRALLDERNTLFERGFVYRKLLPLRELGRSMLGAPLHEELRLFFVGGDLLDLPGYSDLRAEDNGATVTALTALARRFESPFLTVDIARTTEARWRVVEVGDGGVSGLPTALLEEDFYEALARQLAR